MVLLDNIEPEILGDEREHAANEIEEFLNKNTVEYIDKKNYKEWIYYEFKKYYEVVIFDKKIDNMDLILKLFDSKDIILFKIDNVVWKNFKNANKDDIKNAKTLSIRIKKNTAY